MILTPRNDWMRKHAADLAPVRATLLLAGIETELFDAGPAVYALVRDPLERQDRELQITGPAQIEELTTPTNRYWLITVMNMDNGDTIQEEQIDEGPGAVLQVAFIAREWLSDIRI